MTITVNNFHISTEALFKGCKIPKREPMFVSESGSRYWHGCDSIGEYVIRESDHWVNIKYIGSNKIFSDCRSIASCNWNLKTNNNSRIRAGKAYLKDFKKI